MFSEKENKNASIYMKYIYHSVRGKNIEMTANCSSLKKRIEVSDDTKHRQDIHATMNRLLSPCLETKLGFDEIIEELNKKFPNSKYKEYFPIWLKDKMDKNKRNKKNMERDF